MWEYVGIVVLVWIAVQVILYTNSRLRWKRLHTKIYMVSRTTREPLETNILFADDNKNSAEKVMAKMLELEKDKEAAYKIIVMTLNDKNVYNTEKEVDKRG